MSLLRAFSLFIGLLLPTSVFVSGPTGAMYAAPLIVFSVSSLRLKLNRIVISVFCLIVIAITVALSLFNGASLVSVGLKIGYLLLLFILLECVNFGKKNKVFFALLLCFIVISLLIQIFGSAEERVHIISRFSGYSFDPNYFSLITMTLFIGTFFISCKSLKYLVLLRLSLFAFIVLSLSLTGISLTIVFLLLMSMSSIKQINLLFKIPFVFILVLSMYFLYLYLIFYFSELELESGISEYWKYKAVSVNQRLAAQLEAIEILFESPRYFLFGVGGGRTIELVGKAVHNGFLQAQFAHGIFFFLSFILYLFRILIRVSNRLSGRDQLVFSIGVLLLLVGNFSLDTIFSFVLPLFVIIARTMVVHEECSNIKRRVS